ncbi:NAD(P)-binding domain-containing protein [Ruegeria sp. R13_0]|uniref:flavin-containing monooxygenase n=1 Tax=Ruegeria sp. R13_0 TaxID=2821099 RepID=UPI001ADA8DE7|nr:NAD(P)/FAD-dependent oxidoreductase [Ruegeria sp. R13_0]MBO9433327.1 NAD(P)-binding domain-containing protein [Ruegeria sp. R13_0]
MENFDTVVIGAGQAGIATSEHLRAHGIDHVLLERGRIAERWRSERWDSLVANGPAWHDRFPGLEFSGDRDAFPRKECVAQYFEDYAKMIDAPVRTGVTVTRARPHENRVGFLIETSQGPIEARHLVCATGPFQKPAIPPIIPESSDVLQMHSTAYRNPNALPEGAVLVIGGGSSGSQIAAELHDAGREVFFSIGPHDRPPRRYRGRDNVWWLGVLGIWNLDTPAPGTEHVTIAVSGAHGGKTVDFRKLAQRGITLLGMSSGFENGVLHIADDLQANLDAGDANMLSLLEAADAYVARTGIDLPEEPEAWVIPDDPACVSDPIRELDLERNNIRTVIWATGFQFNYDWLEADTLDDRGRPIHQRGVSPVPGLYFVGLPWQSRRGSSFIWGVWHDAKFIADQISIQKNYLAYTPNSA